MGRKLIVGTMFGKHDLSKVNFGMNRNNKASPFKDSDGDGVNDFADCQPHNPNKQGVLHDIRTKYQAWKAKAPQRREQRLTSERERAKITGEREQRRIEALERKARIEKQYTEIERTKAARREAGLRGRPKPAPMSAGFGGMMDGMGKAKPLPIGLGLGFEQAPMKAIKVARKKKPRRKARMKAARKQQYIIRGGKAYLIG